MLVSRFTELPCVLAPQNVQKHSSCFSSFLGSIPLPPFIRILFFPKLCCPVLLDVAFIPSSVSKLWGLVPEKSPGESTFRVQRVVAAAAPSVFSPGPHLLSEWPSPCTFIWHSRLHPPCFQGGTLASLVFFGPSGNNASSRFLPQADPMQVSGSLLMYPTCSFGSLGIPYQLVCLKILSLNIFCFSL